MPDELKNNILNVLLQYCAKYSNLMKKQLLRKGDLGFICYGKICAGFFL